MRINLEDTAPDLVETGHALNPGCTSHSLFCVIPSLSLLPILAHPTHSCAGIPLCRYQVRGLPPRKLTPLPGPQSSLCAITVLSAPLLRAPPEPWSPLRVSPGS